MESDGWKLQQFEIAADAWISAQGARTGGGSDVSFAGHLGTPGLDGLGPIGGLDHGPMSTFWRAASCRALRCWPS